MTNDDIIITESEWLKRHVDASNHKNGKPDVTCPMCIRIITAYAKAGLVPERRG